MVLRFHEDQRSLKWAENHLQAACRCITKLQLEIFITSTAVPDISRRKRIHDELGAFGAVTQKAAGVNVEAENAPAQHRSDQVRTESAKKRQWTVEMKADR